MKGDEMNSYSERQAAKVERLELKIQSKRKVAAENDLSLYGEEKSGIPLGQPILVGHHSERRHRRHLERIEKKVRSGYEAAKQVDQLESRLEAIKSKRSIDSDNPDAAVLIANKIQRLEAERDRKKRINAMVKRACIKPNSIDALAKMLEENFNDIAEPRIMAEKLLTPDFAGGLGIPQWYFTNTSAEIRRMKKRLEAIETLNQGWDPIEFSGGRIFVEDGRVIVEFASNPSLDITQRLIKEGLKKSPFVFKYSPTKKLWVRKHTPTTQSSFFRKQLEQFVKGFDNE